MKEELIDYCDENRKHLGSMSRSEVHRQGLWHECIHCWLIRKKGDQCFLIFQKRSDQAEISPSQYDTTSAGHLLAGETPKEAHREINEELGVECSYEDLIPLGILCQTCREGDIVEQTFDHVYLLECDLPWESFKLQQEEVKGLVQMDIEDGFRLFSKEVDSVPVTGFELDSQGQFHPVSTEISRDDIVARHGFFLSLLVSIERYFEGRQYISI